MGKQQQPRQRGLVGSILSLALLPLTICIALVRIVFRGLMSLDRKQAPRTTPYNRPPSPLGVPPSPQPPPAPQPRLFGYPRSFVVVAVVLIVIAGLGGGWVIGQISGGGAPAAAVATNTPFPTFPPTATTVPATATPNGPHVLDTPTLGGTQDAFTAAFGQPDASGIYPRYTFTTSDGYQLVLVVSDPMSGKDSQQHIARIGFSPQPGISLTAQDVANLLPRFLPPDARHVRDFTDPQIGLIHVYISADLGATFPASDFSDSGTGQALPPGTFGAACNQPSAPGPGCDVVLGD